MRNRRSFITWGIIFLILVGSGILTIFLPALLGGEAATPLPSQPSTVTITPPIPIAGRGSFTLPSWQLMLGLAVLVPGLVVGAGLTLGIVAILLSRFMNRTRATSDYRQNVDALDRRQKERIAQLRQTRPTSAAPPTTWKRWAVITTALTILMFVGFGTLLVASLLFPSWQIIRQDEIVSIVSVATLIALLAALIIMAFTLRGDRLTAPDRSGALPIPWDFIAVVITGLLVVGLGIAVIAILNAPQ